MRMENFGPLFKKFHYIDTQLLVLISFLINPIQVFPKFNDLT